MSKTFTVTQANRTLPLVSRIVHDIVSMYGRWAEHVREIEVISAGARADAPDARAAALEQEAQSLAREIDGCIGELAELGVEYKPPLDAGLVDFPGELDGRRVYLCWRLGERSVAHWHELDGGFAGRHPIPTPT
jgi:hypothetical protein